MKTSPASKLNIISYIIVSLICLFILGVHVVRHATTPILSQTVQEPPDLAESAEIVEKSEEPTADELISRFTPESEQSYKDYVAKTYSYEGSRANYIVVQQRGKVVFFEKGYRYNIGQAADESETTPVSMGKDINNNGPPDLVIYQYTGGAHCCDKYYVFELVDTFKKVATIDNHALGRFIKQNGTNELVYDTYDNIFVYWHESYAGSPMPSIKLRYCNNDYRLADDLMRKPPPSRAKLLKQANAILKENSWTSQSYAVPTLLWSSMLDLIYSGNTKSAYVLFDLAWSPNVPGKDLFLDEFNKNLAESEYWQDIKIMNEGKPVCRRNE